MYGECTGSLLARCREVITTVGSALQFEDQRGMRMERPSSIDVDVDKDVNGEIQRARIRFGPHHAVEVRKDGGKTSFAVVATHHGFKADASELNSELERIVQEVRATHPDTIVD